MYDALIKSMCSTTRLRKLLFIDYTTRTTPPRPYSYPLSVSIVRLFRLNFPSEVRKSLQDLQPSVSRSPHTTTIVVLKSSPVCENPSVLEALNRMRFQPRRHVAASGRVV